MQQTLTSTFTLILQPSIVVLSSASMAASRSAAVVKSPTLQFTRRGGQGSSTERPALEQCTSEHGTDQLLDDQAHKGLRQCISEHGAWGMQPDVRRCTVLNH